jgi:O-antigen/teichoic acid export membrane protein
VLSYVTIFGVIIDFGIQQYIVKKMSEEPQAVKHYFHHYLAFGSLVSVIVYAALLVTAWLGHYEPLIFYAIAVAGSGLIITALTYPFLAVMSAHQDLGKVAFINLVNSVVNVVIIFLAIILHKYIVFLVLVQPIAAFSSLVIYLYYIRQYIPHPEFMKAFHGLDFPLIKNMTRAVLPFALLVGFSTIYNRIDVVIITKMLGFAQNGLYTAAYKFFDLVAFFPAVVSHALYPMFASLMARHALSEVRAGLEKYLRFMIALALPMAVGGTLLARQMILLLTSNDARYLPAAPVLAIVVWAPAALFIYVVANSLVISQLTKFAVIITGANVLINVIGNLILLPRMGIRGAAVMTVVSESVQGLFYLYFIYRKITRFKFFSWWWRPLVASAAMGAAVWYVRPHGFLIALAGGMIVYLGMLLILRFFNRGDIDFARQILRRQSNTV